MTSTVADEIRHVLSKKVSREGTTPVHLAIALSAGFLKVGGTKILTDSEMLKQRHIGLDDVVGIGDALPVGGGAGFSDPTPRILEHYARGAAWIHFEKRPAAVRKRRKEKSPPIGRPIDKLNALLWRHRMNYFRLFAG